LVTAAVTRRRTLRERDGVFDWVVVDRLCAGLNVPDATLAERRDAARRLLHRYPAAVVAARTGLSERTITRYRSVPA
jgi:uncharacterized protein YerC